MWHSRPNNSKINRLHERCQRIIYSDKKSSFEALLGKDSFVSIHNRNLQLLAVEMYKASKVLSRPIITELFEKKNDHQHKLRHILCEFGVSWDWKRFISGSKKLGHVTRSFKTAIKSWKPEKCPCRLCRIYIHNVGFI